MKTYTSIALVSCDGLGGYDWSDQAEERLNYALMVFSSSSSESKVSNDSTCSKSCLETIKLLKSQNDHLLKDLKKSELMVLGYKTGLKSVEERLEFIKQIFLLKDMDQDSSHMVATSKVPMLKPSIPNEHRLKFNYIKDSKKLLEAVEKRFGRNVATNKTQRNLLKQQYENFTAPSSEMLNQTFDRLQNLDLEQIHPYDIEKMDLRWEMAILTIRARRFLKRTRRKLIVNGNETVSFDKSNVRCYNFHKRGHLVRDYRALRNQDNKYKESSRRSVPMKTYTSTALVSWDGLGGYDWSDQADERLNYALMAFSSSSSDSKVSNDSTCLKSCLETVKLLKSQNDHLLKDLKKSELMVLGYKTGLKSVEERLEFIKQIVDNCKKGLGYENYNEVPPPHTGNFMPPTPDLSFTGLDEFVNKLVVENRKAKSSEEEPKVV
nr:hypothetical protein [Tanacetum cinerariifolium]